jgi:hypothetical protein
MCGFLDCQPAERAKLDDGGELRIERFQLTQGVVERKNRYLAGRGSISGFVEGHARDALTALGRTVTPRVIDEDSAHHLCRHAEKMRAIVPVDVPLIDETQIHLMDERSRLQGMTGPFAAKLTRGDAAQLGVDERKQLMECFGIAATPVAEKRGDVPTRGNDRILQNVSFASLRP